MRVLHVVKTSDGANWAAWQVTELIRHGHDVHVAIPRPQGTNVSLWRESGATVHIADCSIPVSRPHHLPARMRLARDLVNSIAPDIIHVHNVTNIMLLRLALGKKHRTPRVFQVPGPLHLEHGFYRRAELALAGPADYWIASSRCIARHYAEAGIPDSRVFLSYYAQATKAPETRSGVLRSRFGIGEDQLVVGNVSWMYPPKLHLGHTRGIKRHEDIIDALGAVFQARHDVVGILVGGAWGAASWYEDQLRKRAERIGKGRIFVTGSIPHAAVTQSWPDFDCAVHVPISENCGGVVEPLAAGVPTIAAQTGGLGEVVMDGITGKLVPAKSPSHLAEAILTVLGNLPYYRSLARNGQRLVKEMFDPGRTAAEIAAVYHHIRGTADAPSQFDPRAFCVQNTCSAP